MPICQYLNFKGFLAIKKFSAVRFLREKILKNIHSDYLHSLFFKFTIFNVYSFKIQCFRLNAIKTKKNKKKIWLFLKNLRGG